MLDGVINILFITLYHSVVNLG